MYNCFYVSYKYTDHFIKSKKKYIYIYSDKITSTSRETIYLPGRVKKISILTVGDTQIFKSVDDIFIKPKIRVERRMKKLQLLNAKYDKTIIH